jgi:hypothetical protein
MQIPRPVHCTHASHTDYPLDQVTVHERGARLELLFKSTIFRIEGLGYSLGIQNSLSNLTGW